MIFSRGLILLFSVFLACAAHQAETGDTKEEVKKTGILQGKVTVGPLRPGPARIDDTQEPPAELFASHKIVILSAEDKSKVVQEVKLDAKGNFKTELPPGKYLVDFQPHDIGMPKMQKVELPAVTIAAGETATVNLDIDTGMR